MSEAEPATRRHLSARQAQTVANLVEAAVGELAASGYSALTVRNVAKRAGVAPATAYTYFASKEHLIAEVYWRRYSAAEPAAPDRRRSPANRAVDVLMDFALVVADETDLAAATTVAMLADDPEVRDLRARIGLELHQRLLSAVGDEASPAAVTALELAISGALLQVGTGHLAYDDLPDLLTDVCTQVLGGASR